MLHTRSRGTGTDRASGVGSAEAGGALRVRIAESKGWTSLGLREVWQYRELLYFLIWRDISVRYRQTVFGIAWAVIQPFFAMVVFTLFFGRLAKLPSDGIPYPIFSYSALVPWTFFANGLSQAANSVVRDSNLITKVYFPRLVIPLSAVVGGVVDLGVAFIVLLGMMVGFGIWPTANIGWLPLLVLLAMASALSVGLWLAALNVQFRDVRYVVPFILQIWLFSTPVMYSTTLVPKAWRTLYGINPMVGVIEGFRWALLGTQTRPGPIIMVSVLTVLILLVTGAWYFRRMERTFADIV
jgi:lipopolysaccharide transport system permease protein